MHPYKVIFHIDRWSGGLSKILEDSNNITFQSVDKNDAPSDPLHGPVIEVSCIIILAPYIISIIENYHIEVMNKFYNIIYDD